MRHQSLVLAVFGLFTSIGIGFVQPDAVAQVSVPRILQGVETDDYPSVGIVGSLRNGGFCTGTLISPTHVLTAAHCAEVIESPTAGTFDLDGQVYGTSNVVIHPDFNSFTFANDIAILVLNEPVLDVEPSQIFRGTPLVGDLLFIVGFGGTGTADGGNDGSFGVKRVGVTTIDEVTASLVNWFFDDPSEANTASGDSGGPGYLDLDGDLFIACITSGGTEPDSVLGDFAFNTRIDAYADWIDLTLLATDEPPSSDDPGSDDPGQPDDDPWSQPFPILQWLINVLTQLLEYLTDGQFTGDDPAVAPPTDAETPDTPPPSAGDGPDGPVDDGGATQPADETDSPGDTPGTGTPDTPDDETPADNPAECPPTTPVDPPTTPVDEPTTPVEEPTTPVEEPTDPIDIPTDPIDIPDDIPIDIPADPIDIPDDIPIDIPGGLPSDVTIPGGAGGGTPPQGGMSGGTSSFSDRVYDTSASVLAGWNRYIQMLLGR